MTGRLAQAFCCSRPVGSSLRVNHFARSYAAAATTDAGDASQRVALVTGASRGLGLEFARQLLQRPNQSVVAACRNPDEAQQLRGLAAEHPNNLSLVRLDVTDEASIQAAADEVSQRHKHLDLLLNVAGVLHVPGEFSPETALARLELNNLEKVFAVNTFGPILVSKAFAPLLINAAKVSAATDDRPAVIANLSARVGSISDNALGGWYSYRASKTALNQLTKTMVVEFQRRRQKVACLLLHPGTVDTDLSAPFQKNVKPEKLFTRERAIQQLLSIIDNTKMDNTGTYVAWDGTTIPW
eukprot:CAMPEP_0206141840 /NCGR_PEP_ID=MMETSP1473-20131121/14362_1 /ASSEMBLY_ACC=CAM_ASM_001109 /TAXON_ID=1461547 /ORGANISM="Stichococcus sp, Strain RCC1054" /LENGTH=297 /DNA_ID=CAMNT_0053536565 /DNA_START=261 /DNA_END=1154 /DNA_ORIENTATION=+